jgi:hypothetical protein
MKNLFSLLAFMLIIGTSSVSAESNLNNKETFSLELSEDFTTVSTISVLENQLVSLESQYNVSEDYFGYCRILANKIAGMIGQTSKKKLYLMLSQPFVKHLLKIKYEVV